MNKKENAERAQLRQRLLDLMYGALGIYVIDSDELVDLPAEMGLSAWGRWLYAIQRRLLNDDPQYLVNFHVMEHYKSLDEAIDYLYGNGVRV